MCVCANNHLNNVTAVEEGDTLYLSHITSTNRKSSCRFHVAFKFNFSVVSVAVKLPNLKAIRLKRAEI